MKIIGFNFTKISAEKSSAELKQGAKIDANINFLDVKKEDILLSEKDSEALRVLFNFSVKYSNQDEEAEKKSGEKSENNGEVSFKGFFILTVSNEEAKAILKDWKKQEISEFIRVPLFNFILRRCSVRAMQLEEELGLPLHVPLPQISAPQTPETKKE